MGNEMKLLMALCDALGFEVETTYDDQKRKEAERSAMQHNSGVGTNRRLLASGPYGALDIDGDGLYTSVLREPIIDYKLTRKPVQGGTGGSWPRDGCPQGIGS